MLKQERIQRSGRNESIFKTVASMLKQECSMLKQEYINVKTGMDPMLSKCLNRNESNVKTGMNPVLKQE